MILFSSLKDFCDLFSLVLVLVSSRRQSAVLPRQRHRLQEVERALLLLPAAAYAQAEPEVETAGHRAGTEARVAQELQHDATGTGLARGIASDLRWRAQGAWAAGALGDAGILRCSRRCAGRISISARSRRA